MIIAFKGQEPKIHPDSWIAPGAVVVGDVEIGQGASIWFNAVVRADVNSIRIGKNSNIQDNCTLHVDHEHSIRLADNVFVAHGAVLHGCTIEDACLVGMGAIILNGAKIGAGSIIGAGTLVPENMVVPRQSLVVGMPGRIIKTIGNSMENDLRNVYGPAYVALWKDYAMVKDI